MNEDAQSRAGEPLTFVLVLVLFFLFFSFFFFLLKLIFPELAVNSYQTSTEMLC